MKPGGNGPADGSGSRRHAAAAALFRIDRGRNWHGLQNLPGDLVQGTICSDRHGPYGRPRVDRRAICWAHPKRDFRRFVDRGGPAARLGDGGLLLTRGVFDPWHRLRAGGVKRKTLRRHIGPVRQRMRDLLDRGRATGGVKKAEHFCRNLLKVFDGLWAFARESTASNRPTTTPSGCCAPPSRLA